MCYFNSHPAAHLENGKTEHYCKFNSAGKYRRTRLFVLTLGCSRKAVRWLSFRSSSHIWAELHEKTFRRLGGSTRTVVLDNLKERVLVPDIYDPALNPLYRDVLTHYGCVALPCRIQRPDRKGKVERGAGHAKNTPLKGKRFEILEEAQPEVHWPALCRCWRCKSCIKLSKQPCVGELEKRVRT